MRESDAWWGHVPIVAKSYWNLDTHSDWNINQITSAVAIISARYPDALAAIPKTGFYIMAARRVAEYRDATPPDLHSAVALWEDTDGLERRKALRVNVTARGGSVHEPLDRLGSEHNPFIALFESLALDIPTAWPRYLKWRKRQPRKPVPEWLSQLRERETAKLPKTQAKP